MQAVRRATPVAPAARMLAARSPAAALSPDRRQARKPVGRARVSKVRAAIPVRPAPMRRSACRRPALVYPPWVSLRPALVARAVEAAHRMRATAVKARPTQVAAHPRAVRRAKAYSKAPAVVAEPVRKVVPAALEAEPLVAALPVEAREEPRVAVLRAADRAVATLRAATLAVDRTVVALQVATLAADRVVVEQPADIRPPVVVAAECPAAVVQ